MHNARRPSSCSISREAELVVVIAHHRVLRRRDIFADQPGRAAPPRLGDQQRQRRRLDAAAEHAAAHQPRVDDESVAFVPTDDDGDQAVVAEAVDQPQMQADDVFVAQQSVVVGLADSGASSG